MKRSLLVLGLLCLFGCGKDTGGGGGGSLPSGSVCGSSTLTYTNFGQQFMGSYCNRCHSSSVTGTARGGAPTNVNFDSLQDIQAQLYDIDRTSAAGPNGVSTSMPFNPPNPTEAERQQLGQWLACGAP